MLSSLCHPWSQLPNYPYIKANLDASTLSHAICLPRVYDNLKLLFYVNQTSGQLCSVLISLKKDTCRDSKSFQWDIVTILIVNDQSALTKECTTTHAYYIYIYIIF